MWNWVLKLCVATTVIFEGKYLLLFFENTAKILWRDTLQNSAWGKLMIRNVKSSVFPEMDS